MSMKFGHGFCVRFVHQRDNWRSGFRVGQGFYDGEALRIAAEVHDGQIDIVQSEAEDIKRVFLGICFCFPGCTPAAVTYQYNIPFHKLS